ncbi:hypothetical protein E2562_000571 [Oryza meyeriana var. granulata]|uniref:Uncharacterized protein n=1 Tax=Oryza meyeriana var. granulata TaxID=110450 RepID=A0A6G1DTH2_9ORYZ|nr:hypothetical protein E2562_000571 [Oryza meyeriana var. granulata]
MDEDENEALCLIMRQTMQGKKSEARIRRGGVYDGDEIYGKLVVCIDGRNNTRSEKENEDMKERRPKPNNLGQCLSSFDPVSGDS